MRVVLADDEARVRRGLRRMLLEIAQREDNDLQLEIVGEARDGKEALRLVRDVDPDLLFLDVRMPALDGLDVADLLTPGRRPRVIFATAHDEYAVRAFEQQAIDYLVKPFGEERLQQALSRAQEALGRREERDVPAAPAGPERFVARVGTAARIIAAEDILAVEAASNYVYLHTLQSSALLRATLAEMEARLEAEQFIRTHRSWMVRITAILEIQRQRGEIRLKLEDGSEVPLSRSARAAFEARLGKIP